MRDDGLWGQWRQGALAIRALSHIGVAAESSRGRSPRVRGALLAASLGLDAWVAFRPRHGARRAVGEILLGMADVAAWSWLARDEAAHVRGLVFATLAPNAMETGFRLGAGTTTVPVIEPAVEWRPVITPSIRAWARARIARARRVPPNTDGAPGLPRVDVARALRVVGRVTSDAAPLLAAMVVTRRRRGAAIGTEPVVWTAIGAVAGYALARTRAAAQASTTRLWEHRTAYLIDEARIRSRVQSALVHNVTEIDPKAMLTLLERAGSTSAQRALDELTSTPVASVSNATEQGITLAATVDLRAVTPESFRTRWVPRSQVRIIRDAMATIDRELDRELDRVDARTPDDDEVTVVAADPRRLVLSYRGVTIEAHQPVPDLAIRLEPTVWVVLASAVLTAFSGFASEDHATPTAFAAALALQALAIRRVLTTPPIERRGDRTTAMLLTASSLLLDVSVARRRPLPSFDPRTGERIETCAGTAATQPVMMLLGTSWHDLRAEGPLLLGAALAGWGLSLRPWFGRSWHSLVVEGAFLVMPLLANLGVGVRTDHEANLLDAALQKRLSERIDAAARVEAQGEVQRFVDQLDVVIAELPGLHPGLTEADVDEIISAYRAERDRITTGDPLELIGW